mgnify:CR=1 FL=1
MRKALIYILLLMPLALGAQIPGKVVEMEGAFLEQIQERDSVLIADQLRYGFDLKQVEEGNWKRVLFMPTGALLSKTSFNEGQSVPGIAHALVLENIEN